MATTRTRARQLPPSRPRRGRKKAQLDNPDLFLRERNAGRLKRKSLNRVKQEVQGEEEPIEVEETRFEMQTPATNTSMQQDKILCLTGAPLELHITETWKLVFCCDGKSLYCVQDDETEHDLDQFTEENTSSWSWECFLTDSTVFVQFADSPRAPQNVHHYCLLVNYRDKSIAIEKLSETAYRLMHRQIQKKNTDSLRTHQLWHLRQCTKPDFRLICNDGREIEAHRFVLDSFWPHFQSLSEHKSLTLPYPAHWIHPLVACLYGAQNTHELNFDQATGCLILAEEYNLPGLSQMAYRRLRSIIQGKEHPGGIAADHDMSFQRLFEGWKRAREANHSQAVLLLAEQLLNRFGPSDNADLVKDVPPQFFQDLLVNIAMIYRNQKEQNTHSREIREIQSPESDDEAW
ncbi:hypothetical protein CJU89_4031 [Yarrowia sp. B02]|nr:hypothetical protein CJU89_4031 [Yarrowia sp. B02]